MNFTLESVIAVVLVLIVLAAIVGMVSRRRRVEQLHDDFGPEYDRTVHALGDENKAQTELEERRKRVEALHLRTLEPNERERFLAEWAAVQSKFVDDPAGAIGDADRLIQQAMQTRGYPVSDFERRAADISVNHPKVVSNYRAAHEIALKNEQNQATTEELRQAMIYYRSLFEELLGAEAGIEREKQV